MKTTRFVDRLDKTEPALIVRNGNTTRKHIALERSGVTLGRARGCDVQLDAPDVSAVHCVITRGAAGVFIRDCGSRCGTKVNGVKIEEAPLHSTDVIQIGSFGFEVYLPWTQTPRDAENASRDVAKQQLARAEKSRERLAGLALHLRKRLHEERIARAQTMVDTWPVPQRHKDKSSPSAEQAQREAELMEREKAIAERQLQLDQQAAELERQKAQFEQPRPRLGAHRAAATQLGPSQRDLVLSALEQRRQELEEYAGKLREAYEQLTAQEAHLKEVAAEVQQGQEQLELARSQFAAERADLETARVALLAQRDQLECKQAELEARASAANGHHDEAEEPRLDDFIHVLRDLCNQALRRHESEVAAFRELCDQLDSMK